MARSSDTDIAIEQRSASSFLRCVTLRIPEFVSKARSSSRGTRRRTFRPRGARSARRHSRAASHSEASERLPTPRSAKTSSSICQTSDTGSLLMIQRSVANDVLLTHTDSWPRR